MKIILSISLVLNLLFSYVAFAVWYDMEYPREKGLASIAIEQEGERDVANCVNENR